MIRIGLDPGGSKIEAVTLYDDGVERGRECIATPRGDYAATLAAIAGLVRNGVQKVGAGDTADGTNAAAKVTLGIGIPGSESVLPRLAETADSAFRTNQRQPGIHSDSIEAHGVNPASSPFQ